MSIRSEETHAVQGLANLLPRTKHLSTGVGISVLSFRCAQHGDWLLSFFVSSTQKKNHIRPWWGLSRPWIAYSSDAD